MANAQAQSHIGHSELQSFAEEVVNLGREDVKEYREQVARLRARLTAHIQEHPDYDLVKMLHSGSVAKGLALRTLNDMDVAVYVKASAAPKDETKLLLWLAERLREANPQLKAEQIEPKSHCVRVAFRGSGLDVDIAPVLYEGDSDDKGFLIVRETGDRVLTSIPMHLAFTRRRKEKNPTHFAQIVRFLKYWAREQKLKNENFWFKSFLAELLCAHLAEQALDLSDYPAALESIFAYIVKTEMQARISFADYYKSEQLPKERKGIIEIFDPVNPDNNVASRYTENNRKLIVEAAHHALDSITEAHYATTKDRALQMWKRVFGPTFRVNQ